VRIGAPCHDVLADGPTRDDTPVIWTLLGILLGVAVGSLLVLLVILPGKRARRRRWARRG